MDDGSRRQDPSRRQGPDPEADPTTWFEPLYADAARGARAIPWDRGAPHPHLVSWASRTTTHSRDQRAIVVGTGTGDDAAFVASLGYGTTAFDVSPTAVSTARERYPDAEVTFTVADLFRLPAEWIGGYDLVVEIQTVQSLPRSMRDAAISAVASLVAPGGRLLVIAAVAESPRTEGPPWPLTREELAGFGDAGVTPITVDHVPTSDGSPFASHWVAEYARSPTA